MAKKLSEQYKCSAEDLHKLTTIDNNFDNESAAVTESAEFEQKASRLRMLIEAKQERERTIKRKEEERKVEEKRMQDQAMMVRAGEGIIDWKSIVEAKRKKQKAQEEQDNEGKPDIFNLDRDYNCVKHLQDFFIDGDKDTENISITLYRKLLPCPLRSQLKSIKDRMFHQGGVHLSNKLEKDGDQKYIDTVITSFLNEKAV